MTTTLDTNVLVYASDTGAPEHERAQALLEHLAAGPDLVVLLWPTLLGYLRLVTHPSICDAPLPVDRRGRPCRGIFARQGVAGSNDMGVIWLSSPSGPGCDLRVPDSRDDVSRR